MDAIFLSPIRLEDLASTIEGIVNKAINQKQENDLAERLLSPEETCKLFNPQISKVTLHNWERQGRLKKYRMGGRVFYKYSEILAGMESLIRYKKPQVAARG
jgi:hypothetical protein